MLLLNSGQIKVTTIVETRLKAHRYQTRIKKNLSVVNDRYFEY